MAATGEYARDNAALQPVAAAIAAVVESRTVLLVRRLNPPDVGRWGFPGGKIKLGEPIQQAAIRELYEETGLRATAERVFTAVDVFHRDSCAISRRHFVLIAVLCCNPTGLLTPGSDAGDARWFHLDEIEDATVATSIQVADVAREAVALASGERQ